jgi:acyl-CoA thioester hydrolase
VADASRFKFSHPIHVIFRDVDGMRHVNHAVYLSYAEAARSLYWMQVTGMRNIEEFDFVLAEITARYRAPAQLHDRLVVACAITELRRSSFLMEYEIRNADTGQLVFEMSSVQVMYDYAHGQVMPIPELRRRQIEAFEGRSLSASRE